MLNNLPTPAQCLSVYWERAELAHSVLQFMVYSFLGIPKGFLKLLKNKTLISTFCCILLSVFIK
jgi:hypothetical protein